MMQKFSLIYSFYSSYQHLYSVGSVKWRFFGFKRRNQGFYLLPKKGATRWNISLGHASIFLPSYLQHTVITLFFEYIVLFRQHVFTVTQSKGLKHFLHCISCGITVNTKFGAFRHKSSLFQLRLPPGVHRVWPRSRGVAFWTRPRVQAILKK